VTNAALGSGTTRSAAVPRIFPNQQRVK